MSTFNTIVAFANNINEIEACESIARQFQDAELEDVLIFCSASFDVEKLSEAIRQELGQYNVIGCTTAGEITPKGYKQGGLLAIGFDPNCFKIAAKLVKNLPDFDLLQAQKIINELSELSYSAKMNGFILTLVDGLAQKEEEFLFTLDSASAALPNFGGSAGDDINLAKTHVYYAGQFHRNAAVVIQINTHLPFEVFSYSHIAQAGEKLVVTDVDVNKRTVYEINGEPAAKFYADLLNIDVEDLTPELFAIHPLAVKVGGEYYIRSIQQVNYNDHSLVFYCAVDMGIVLTQVKLGDIIESHTRGMHELKEKLGEPEMVLTCDCFLNRLEIEQKKIQQAATELFQQFAIVGFNAYGEHRGRMHLNQTFTGVYIGKIENEQS